MENPQEPSFFEAKLNLSLCLYFCLLLPFSLFFLAPSSISLPPLPSALGTIKGFKWQCVVSRVWVQCPSEYFIHPALKLALRRFYVEAAVGEIQITDLWFFTL